MVSKLSDSSLGQLISQPSGFLARLVSITKAAEESLVLPYRQALQKMLPDYSYIYDTFHLLHVMGAFEKGHGKCSCVEKIQYAKTKK